MHIITFDNLKCILFAAVILQIAFTGCQSESDITKEVLQKTRCRASSRMKFNSSEEVQSLLGQIQNEIIVMQKQKLIKVTISYL